MVKDNEIRVYCKIIILKEVRLPASGQVYQRWPIGVIKRTNFRLTFCSVSTLHLDIVWSATGDSLSFIVTVDDSDELFEDSFSWVVSSDDGHFVSTLTTFPSSRWMELDPEVFGEPIEGFLFSFNFNNEHWDLVVLDQVNNELWPKDSLVDDDGEKKPLMDFWVAFLRIALSSCFVLDGGKIRFKCGCEEEEDSNTSKTSMSSDEL